MYERPRVQQGQFALNTAGTVITGFYFPKASRIKRYFAIPTLADQAAHATIVDTVTFTNRGADGAGTTVLAILTNDSDLANSTTRKSAAWVRYDALEINTEARPVSADATNVADEIAAGSFISVDLLGAGTTPTANNFIMGVEYVESD